MNENLVTLIREKTTLLKSEKNLDALMKRAEGARIVMIGGSTHGSKEFYLWRNEITRRLIREKGFSCVALEADWPECFEVNRYVKGYTKREESSATVLRAFCRWPSWMWANEEVREFIEWLHLYNAGRGNPSELVGFYGLDVYSLWESMEALIRHLRKDESKEGKARLRAVYKAYQCFDPYGKNVYEYAKASGFVDKSCEREVVKLLSKIRISAMKGKDPNEMLLSAEMNALVTKNAEKYYRTMMRADNEAWAIREGHMAEALEKLLSYHGQDAKIIVWAHSNHIGDSSATPMAEHGITSLGEIIRRRYGRDSVLLVGCGTYSGTVVAGDYWGSPIKKMPIPNALPGTWEWVFHRAGGADRLLITRDVQHVDAMQKLRKERSIGVVYDPYLESGNYAPVHLLNRYDAFIYIDETQALLPLPVGSIETEEIAETFPAGV